MLRRIVAALVALYGAGPLWADLKYSNPDKQDATIKRSPISDDIRMMERALEADARQVDRLYSTKPIRVVMSPREYLIPANYFGPKGKSEPDTLTVKSAFGFYLFLPNYAGYTKENWRDPFDPRRINVLRVSTTEKSDPSVQFNNLKVLLDEAPAFRANGLEGYKRKGRTSPGDVFWTGTRSNGEFFWFQCTLEPGAPRRPGTYPHCQARYYSQKENLFIAYRYSQNHLEKWLEIDDAIWMKILGWRVK